MIAKPVRSKDESLVDFAHRMAMYFEAVRHQALTDIRQIDSISRAKFIAKPLVTRETERERISHHEKAQSNPILRELLRKMELKVF